jgi:hypothetical protein
MYIEFSNNPCGRKVGDCAVRAISKALGITWETAYLQLATNGLQMCDMPSSDSVIAATLRQNGFERRSLSNTCPDCYTAEDFCREFPTGIYVLFFGGHVACVKDGDLYDAWNSSNEIPQYYWTKERV